MGEKGNVAAQPLAALDAIPLGALKSSPETINAWMDTYLKHREIQEMQRTADAAEAAATAAEAEAKGEAPAN
jgi:hypothetical protein